MLACHCRLLLYARRLPVIPASALFSGYFSPSHAEGGILSRYLQQTGGNAQRTAARAAARAHSRRAALNITPAAAAAAASHACPWREYA